MDWEKKETGNIDYIRVDNNYSLLESRIIVEKPVQQPHLKYILQNKLLEHFPELRDFTGDPSNLGEIARYLELKNIKSFSLILSKITGSPISYASGSQNGNKL